MIGQGAEEAVRQMAGGDQDMHSAAMPTPSNLHISSRLSSALELTTLRDQITGSASLIWSLATQGELIRLKGQPLDVTFMQGQGSLQVLTHDRSATGIVVRMTGQCRHWLAPLHMDKPSMIPCR